ncbi:unnamed protein product [Rangifer tarandus platyrhynchus]|uniref:Uncharacterized protein n=1 Tax=Rangifer tarandus platyrhynchus TaxID=3082113 RepID=A0AC59ZXR5_RANTA
MRLKCSTRPVESCGRMALLAAPGPQRGWRSKPHLSRALRTVRLEPSTAFQPASQQASSPCRQWRPNAWVPSAPVPPRWVAGAPTPTADLGCLGQVRKPLCIRLPGNHMTVSISGSLGTPQAVAGAAPGPAPASHMTASVHRS